ncbi:hypothetical protein HK097_004925 [Rhizophlyctis rosea]|uniref:Uncharacterized protein n=1 Tax=Rhizophlyctis rosea TaxID=64517 RepID=A0AAD5SH32_9FUNG|nr:hypothetical protein HK097_004925 [Rhizophlyctis rosea]
MRKTPSVSDLRAVFEAGPKPPTPVRSSSISKDRNDLPEALLKLLSKDADPDPDMKPRGGLVSAVIDGPSDRSDSPVVEPVIDGSKRVTPVRREHKGGVGAWGSLGRARGASVKSNMRTKNEDATASLSTVAFAEPVEEPRVHQPSSSDIHSTVDISTNDGWTRFGVRRRTSEVETSHTPAHKPAEPVQRDLSIAVAAEQSTSDLEIPSPEPCPTSPSPNSSANTTPYRTRHIQILDSCRVKRTEARQMFPMACISPKPTVQTIDPQKDALTNDHDHDVDTQTGTVDHMRAVWEGVQSGDAPPGNKEVESDNGTNQQVDMDNSVSLASPTPPTKTVTFDSPSPSPVLRPHTPEPEPERITLPEPHHKPTPSSSSSASINLPTPPPKRKTTFKKPHLQKNSCEMIVCNIRLLSLPQTSHSVHEITLHCVTCDSSFVLTAAHECGEEAATQGYIMNLDEEVAGKGGGGLVGGDVEREEEVRSEGAHAFNIVM